MLKRELEKIVHILVIEDNPMNMELAVDLLESYGHEVTGAYDGPEALEHTKTVEFDLILLDMQLPEMDGLEVLKRFKNNPKTTDSTCVPLTAHFMKGDKEHFIEAPNQAIISFI